MQNEIDGLREEMAQAEIGHSSMMEELQSELTSNVCEPPFGHYWVEPTRLYWVAGIRVSWY